MSIKGDVIAVGVVGGVLLLAGWYATKKIGEGMDKLAQLPGAVWDAAKEAAPYVNPADERNVVNTAVNSVYRSASPNNTGTLGTAVYDLWHPPTTTEGVRALPLGASTAVDIYQWATGSKGDQVNDFKKWWASW